MVSNHGIGLSLFHYLTYVHLSLKEKTKNRPCYLTFSKIPPSNAGREMKYE